MNIWQSLLLVVALILLIAAIFSGVRNYAWISKAKSIEGEVVGLLEKTDSDGDSIFKPRIKYRVSEGTRKFVSSYGSSSPAYSIGDMVRVAYSGHNEKQEITQFGSIYGFAFIGGVISIATIVSVIGFAQGTQILKWLHPDLH